MGIKERARFIRKIDNVLEKVVKKQWLNLSHIAETTHWVSQDRQIIIEVRESARLIELKKPYDALEWAQYLVDEGEKAGYRIHKP